MIEELSLKGIGGVRQAHLVFNSDFCVITGESGSGKSSIVRGLELCGGRRANASLLHGDTQEAEVSLVLDEPHSRDSEAQNESTIIRRVLARGGRSRAYLQDRPVSLAQLEQVMDSQLRIQSQFAQMALMDPKNQLDLLDFFGGQRVLGLRSNLEGLVRKAVFQEKRARNIRRKRAELEERLNHAEAVLELARKVKLEEDMESRLATQLQDVDVLIERQKTLERALWELQGGPGDEGICTRLEKVLSWLNDSLVAENPCEWDQDRERVLPAIQALVNEVKAKKQEEDAEELEETRETILHQLGTLQKMKRLAGVQDMAELIAFCRESESQIRWMVESGEEVESLSRESHLTRKEASQLAMELRAVRQEVIEDLEQRVNDYLRELLMDSCSFRVVMNPQDKLRTWGAEEVSFELQGAGDFSGPVSSVASGGELSRIQLALQLCLPSDRLPKTLVFDEVEAGLGGKAALQAGKKLLDLSSRCQVILVTHEAAIAALARQHFLVERDGMQSQVKEIWGERRVEEVARMLAGTGQSPEAQNHARSLLGTGSQVY